MPIGGAIAGGMKDESKTTSSVQMGPSGATEDYFSGVEGSEGINIFGITHGARAGKQGEIQSQYEAIRRMVEGGPGQADVERGTSSTREFADMLKQYQEGGYRPSDQDISSSNTLASQLFNPQRVAMGQAFQDQSVEANRRAALMGRSMNDPILAAKLAQEQTRQSSMLEANQGAWSTNYAMQQPGMRLGFAQQRTNVLGGLASQAMANRQALLGMGQSIQGNERNFRLAQATRTVEGESGGGAKGAITGGIAGYGMMLSTASSIMGGMGGGGGGGMGGGGGGTNYNFPQSAPPPSMPSGGGGGYFHQSNPYAQQGQGLQYPGGGGSNYPSLYSGMNRY